MVNEDRIRIIHMIEMAEATASFLVGRSREDIDRDLMLRFALIQAIEVFGEAASKVSPETRADAPQIPWRIIVSMRNRLIHGDASVVSEILWTTAMEDIPPMVPLRRALIGTDA